MKRIHPVFNVVKLTLAPDDFIIRRQIPPPLPLEIIDGEEEWVVEDILDRKLINWKLWYLVKWKDFGGIQPWENVHAPDIVVEFYWKHPGAARHFWSAEFLSPIPISDLPGLAWPKSPGFGLALAQLGPSRGFRQKKLYNYSNSVKKK